MRIISEGDDITVYNIYYVDVISNSICNSNLCSTSWIKRI